VVQIEDSEGGAQGYTFDLFWGDYSGPTSQDRYRQDPRPVSPDPGSSIATGNPMIAEDMTAEVSAVIGSLQSTKLCAFVRTRSGIGLWRASARPTLISAERPLTIIPAVRTGSWEN
jgi:hypothetical protein